MCCVVAGCGSGGQSANDKVATTIKTFARAVADGDAQTACAQLAPGFQAVPGKNVPCTVAMQAASAQLTSQQKTLLHAIRVESVTITGATATATVLYGSQVQHPQLSAFGDQWRITRQPGG